ncbi:MAG: Arm DNA-binding domain-containing protein [Alteraurantiacibacter sp.]
MLADKAGRAAKAKEKLCKFADSHGLHLHISIATYKDRQFKYRFETDEHLLTLGAYPLGSAS